MISLFVMSLIPLVNDCEKEKKGRVRTMAVLMDVLLICCNLSNTLSVSLTVLCSAVQHMSPDTHQYYEIYCRTYVLAIFNRVIWRLNLIFFYDNVRETFCWMFLSDKR